ncbi:MAG: S24/S26 family peptidase [Paludibacteraceae bacterium]|jgi:hypothetical protein|nr:S24/S26 family peptidase [Prevotellaceae bacterium]
MKELIPNEILLGCAKQMLAEGHTVTLRVAGYSMRPLLEHRRDSVVLAAAEGCKLHDVVLAEIEPDHYVLHRVVALQGENVTLMGDGNLYGCEHCLRGDVVGVVTNFLRRGNDYGCDNRLVRCYVAVWLRMRTIRRWLLLGYRIQLKMGKLISGKKENLS